jgi:hypothetical protein
MPRRRIEPKLGCLRLLMDQRAQFIFVKIVRIHPTQACRGPHRARRQHLERPVLRSGALESLVLGSRRPAARIEAQPQRIVMVQQRSAPLPDQLPQA